MQITPPRLPTQTPSPAKPDASVRATAMALAAALTRTAGGDEAEISAAARAASDRLTADQTPDGQKRAGASDGSSAPPLPLQMSGAEASASTVVRPSDGRPRWEHLPYALHPLAPPTPPPPAIGWSALPELTKISLVTAAFAGAILLGAWIG